jgi:hypothetical protein
MLNSKQFQILTVPFKFVIQNLKRQARRSMSKTHKIFNVHVTKGCYTWFARKKVLPVSVPKHKTSEIFFFSKNFRFFNNSSKMKLFINILVVLALICCLVHYTNSQTRAKSVSNFLNLIEFQYFFCSFCPSSTSLIISNQITHKKNNCRQ